MRLETFWRLQLQPMLKSNCGDAAKFKGESPAQRKYPTIKGSAFGHEIHFQLYILSSLLFNFSICICLSILICTCIKENPPWRECPMLNLEEVTWQLCVNELCTIQPAGELLVRGDLHYIWNWIFFFSNWEISKKAVTWRLCVNSKLDRVPVWLPKVDTGENISSQWKLEKQNVQNTSSQFTLQHLTCNTSSTFWEKK